MTCRCAHREGALVRELEDYFGGLEEEVNRRSREYVRWVQRSLNRLIAAGLSEDGISGDMTRAAVRRFQKQTGLSADGIVGPRTESALIRAGAGAPPGSTDVSTPAPPSSPPLSASSGGSTPGLGGDLAAVRSAAVRLAGEEYDRWRPVGMKLTEGSAAARPYLERYWTEGVGMTAGAAADAIARHTAWSAAFISWIMKSAGAGNAFHYSACHAVYIKEAKDSRLGGGSNPFKAYRVTEVSPRLGDLVCKCRDSCKANYDTVDAGSGCMPTHCDVVVEIRSGSIRTIGGNLGDSVGSTVVATDGQGRVTAPGYFAVIRVGDGAVPPARSGRTDPQPREGSGGGGASGTAVRGANAFGRVFQAAATGRNDPNAYLLAHLSTMIYPDRGLSEAIPGLAARHNTSTANLEHLLHTNDDLFKATFAELVSPFLYDAAARRSETNAEPRFEFRTAGARSGVLGTFGLVRDPEAMVIGTASTVFVVFRGTDRVGTSAAESTGYEWGEWISTDILAVPMSPGGGMRGKVHSGIWKSVDVIKDQLAQDVMAMGGRSKPVWITGHSLGAAQAVLFSAFLAAQHGIRPMGTYAFASPRVGDREFADYVNQLMRPQSLQRFEFVADPVTMVAPRVDEIPLWLRTVGNMLTGGIAGSLMATIKLLKEANLASEYYHPGVRNYYDDVHSFQYAVAERFPNEFGDTLKRALSGFNSFCFHHPQWYLVGAYRQLSDVQRTMVPEPVRLPTESSEACGPHEIARGVSRTATW